MTCHSASLGMLANPRDRAGWGEGHRRQLGDLTGKALGFTKDPDNLWGDMSWIHFGGREVVDSFLLTVQGLDVSQVKRRHSSGSLTPSVLGFPPGVSTIFLRGALGDMKGAF